MPEDFIAVKAPRTRRSRSDTISDIVAVEPTQEQLSALSAKDRDVYVANKRALDKYRAGAKGREIELNMTFVARLNKRFEELDPATGKPRGYYACLPKERKRATHTRKTPIDPEKARQGKGLKGVLGLFFKQHPEIEVALRTYLRTRRTALLIDPTKPLGAPEPVVNAASCFKVFQFYCQQKGLDKRPDEWPYLCADQGYPALRAFYKKWKAAHPKLAADNEHGADAAKEHEVDATMAKSQIAQTVQALPPVYGRIELDGHLLHAVGTVIFKNKVGIPVHVDLRRCYALVARDVRTPLVFAARLCFGLRYDTNDVLGVLRDVLFPRKKRKPSLDHPQFCYREGAGFPGDEDVMPVLWGNAFQELAWDADSAHISAGDTKVIEDLLRCKVAGERIGNPTARSFIEGFNRFLASAFQVLASGTGKNPQDPARRDPEGAAMKYTVTIELLEELLDIWVRNWNATFRPEFGDTPLGGLRKLADQGEVFLNKLGELSGEDRRHEFFPRFRREMVFSRGAHGVLLVNIHGAKYSGPALVGNATLNAARNRWCTVYVNDEDARKGFIVPDEYPQMRIVVFVQNRALAEFPHPLHWRRLTHWWGSVHGKADKAVTPDTMRAAAQAVAQKAAAGEDTARAAISTVVGEQARVESGAVSSIDSDVDWESVSQPVIDAAEADEAVVDPEFAGQRSVKPESAEEDESAPATTQASASSPAAPKAPAATTTRPRIRRSKPGQAPAGPSSFNPLGAAYVPPPRPRHDPLGLGL